jgi:hypothetical protein
MDREDSWVALLQTMSDERVIAWAELTDERSTRSLPSSPRIYPSRTR